MGINPIGMDDKIGHGPKISAIFKFSNQQISKSLNKPKGNSQKPIVLFTPFPNQQIATLVH